MIETKDPDFRLLRDELFGPVVTAYVYPEGEYEETLELVDRTAPYGLTGAVFARDRAAIELAGEKLQYAAGNFYVNDKPTGAVVGQQPFGGARASGHERQGRLDVEPDPLGLAADDQGDVRAADRLPLPVPGAPSELTGASYAARNRSAYDSISRRANRRRLRWRHMRLLVDSSRVADDPRSRVMPVKGF